MGLGDWFKKKNRETFLIEKINEIIEKMEVPELKELCKNVIGSSPRNGLEVQKSNNEVIKYVDPISRDDYERFIQIYLDKKEITIDSIKNYLVRHRFATERFFKQEAEENNSSDKLKKADKAIDFEILIGSIQHDFRPEKVYDEKELQNLLRHFLETKFPNAKVEREVKTKYNDSVDIVINGKYVFECKIPENRTILRNFKAQLEEYQEEYPDVCAVIVDDPERNLSQQIEDHSKIYEKSGIRSVIIEGSKRN